MIDRAFMTISYNRAEFKNRIYYYDNRIREERLLEKKLSGELTEAIVNENIKLYLQPQCTADGSVKGAEALVRWDHPEDGLLLPGRFVPLFERNGLIPVLDRYIWECAAKLLRKWKNEGLLNYYISVNISPTDFFFLDVYDEFHRLIKKYDIDPANLRLEITESIMINDIKRKLTVLEELHKEGFIIEMDDFGSGYSSLNMLKDLPVDAIKIDMGFLYNAGDMDKSKKILRMVVELAKELKMPVICEGVESEFQVEFLNGIGCDYYQGYYFSRPVPIDKFEQHMIQGG
jgi:EAL domain-containing protein (putative c-di-GMP-specific phosphodiesterase class I)